MNSNNNILLGKPVRYVSHYCPSLLCPISRAEKRLPQGICQPLPFHGADIWNAYEVSWLEANHKKPQISVAEIIIPCQSPYLIESKSLKLYLNSFNQTEFSNALEVQETLQNDLSQAAKYPVEVRLRLPPFETLTEKQEPSSSLCLDDLAVKITEFTPNAQILALDDSKVDFVNEHVYSNLFKSNCAVTLQPDWASIYIHYQGKKICHQSLLKYLISFREHADFHEDCVERIYMDITKICQPQQLTVYARYTRRGGLDINPFRSNFEWIQTNKRDFRQ